MKRYAVVGTGSRSVMFIDALAGEFRAAGELVGFCDLSPTRMRWYNDRLKSIYSLPAVPTYPADQFDRMIAEAKADVVIVTTMDSTHHTYVIRAMELGCDVICEKPMTTDADKARAILDAIGRTGRSLRVTFNMRYIPHATKVHELIQSGLIGTPIAVDLSWLLDIRHGADYFRRWHREKEFSGGLLVHKSTHHFDLVNWWVQSYPKTVFAFGGLKFYGRANAIARGEEHLTRYDRYTGHPEAQTDPFALRLDTDPNLRGLYLNAEADSGYIRDRNVFGEPITAEDTVALVARYQSGVTLNYSLGCFSPWEGWNAAITGNRGRIEISARYGTHLMTGRGEDDVALENESDDEYRIGVFPMFEKPYQVNVVGVAGVHSGSDRLMLEQLFSAEDGKNDPHGRAASHLDGAASILMGISANRSIETGLPVDCGRLLNL